jgi:filamentous hemagglutinin family protein
MRLRNVLLASTALLALGAGPAPAGPDGPAVVGGSATVSGAGTSSAVINQNTNRAIINWNTFNIGAGETTTFVQPNSSSVALNRVTGGLGPSQIYGTLNANGYVFVVNRDGVLVGPSGVINTAGFLASTADISNTNFMAGRYNFNIAGQPNASIINQGNITATSGGFAALVAPGVRNTGTITATLGTVALSSGNGFTLDLYGDKLIQLSPSDQIANQVIDVSTGKPLTSLVTNEGKLSANGGRVELTASAARAVVDSVINTTGVIEANSIGTRNGLIVLGAATSDSKGADAPTQTVKVSGTISAAGKQKGTKGGSVVVTGDAVEVAGAKVDVSGDAGGGKVMLGGDWGGGNPNKALVNNQSAALESTKIDNATALSVDAATTIDASAKSSGNGGKVVLWSESQTTFAGTIFARGGNSAGNGGFVEVSGHQSLGFNGTVDLAALKGTGGTLLLDPLNATIDTNPGSQVITAASIQSALATGNVLVTTVGTTGGDVGDIAVAASISWANGSSLTLNANRNITVDSGVTIANTGSGSLNLRADALGTGIGTVNFVGTGKVDFSQSTGLVSIFYNPAGNPAGSLVNPASYTSPSNYSPFVLTNGGVTNQLTAYMLVNTIYDLQNIQNNLSGAYALGKDIDASATTAWNSGAGFIPLGSAATPFTGRLFGFNGNGGVATIDRLSINSPGDYVGLFGYVGAAGSVSGIALTNESISGHFNVGGLAGSNSGTISRSSSGGAVSGANYVGGLVGSNNPTGNILQSFSTAAAGGRLDVGGLVGINQGAITQSYATGTTNPAANPGVAVGGLAGINGGTVTQSYSIGLTAVGGGFAVGGLIGGASANVTFSYWDTQTSARSTSGGGTGQTTAQLKAGLPVGFDPAVWGSSASVNNGYPYLLWTTASTAATTLVPMPGAGPTLPPPPPPCTTCERPRLPFKDVCGTGQIADLTRAINTQAARSTVALPGVLFSGLRQSELERRNAIGLQYALDNPVFQSELSDFIAKLGATALYGPAGELAADLTTKIRDAWEANAKFNRGELS